MTKFFDIKRPRRKDAYTKPSSKQSPTTQKTSRANFLMLIIIICICIFLFSVFNNTKSQYKQKNPDDNQELNNLKFKSTSPISDTDISSTPSISPNIINNATKTPQAENTNNVTISVLNGAGIDGVANQAKTILEKNNISVSEIGNTQNLYSKSVIYYTSENEKIAQKIQEILSNFQPKLENDNTLASKEKIVVVIGKQ